MSKGLKPQYTLNNVNLSRRRFDDFDLRKLFENINYDMLYLRFFNLKKSQSEKIEKTQRDILNIQQEIIEKKLIIPKGVMKIFKASSCGDFIIIKDDNNCEIETIETKRNSNNISISDFVSEDDYVGMLSVSVFLKEGVCAELSSKREYSKLYIINSLAIMMAEAFADVMHKMMMEDFGVSEIGKRYSPGYPSLDISMNKKIHTLLNAEEIGSSITETYMIDPESSVEALVIHNPKSFYL